MSAGPSSLPGPSLAGDSGTGLSGRKLFLRDSVVFLVLLLVTLALYAVTSFLFRSFTTRRQQLGTQFAASGSNALRAGKADQAIEDLRSALEYAPDDRPTHLLLAEALAQAHHTEEATNYFLTLHEAEPADGFLNLQLARLYRAKKDSEHAIDFYRAATLGNWEQDGVAQRLQAQLELAEYLLQLGRDGPARTELLMAAANAPDSVAINLRLGDELRDANAPAAAFASYQKAVGLAPHSFEALSRAARQAYALGDYTSSRRLAELALREPTDPQQEQELLTLSHDSLRLLELSLGRNLPAAERLEHIQAAADLAKRRIDLCVANLSPTTAQPALQELKTQWQQIAPSVRRAAAQSADAEDNIVRLIFATETQTAGLCGAPTGDDALLLRLAKTSATAPQEKP